ncbi:MAG: peptidase dimerization domain-containing protein [Puniceicoccaceae bacterium]
MGKTLSDILALQPGRLADLENLREMLLANAVMLGEIPSPTFGEEDRIRLLRDRYIEAGLEQVSIDEVGNAAAFVPGKKGNRTILVTANADSVLGREVDHAMTLHLGQISGPGIAENAIGLATVSLLPTLLERLGLELDSNLILLATTRSLGLGNIEGLRFFLDHCKQRLDFGVCVRGVHLGRLSYNSLGMIRGEIHVAVPEHSEWLRLGSGGAITFLNRIITQLLAIPLPRQPRTVIILGSITAGHTFNTPAPTGRLRFEIRSEDGQMPDRLLAIIQEIVDENDAESEADVNLQVVSRRLLGGISFSHPLVKTMRAIDESLEIEPVIAPSTGELCALIDKGIPSVTIGLTTAANQHEVNESIAIQPIFRGVIQLISLLDAIDQGHCDDEN